MTKNTNQFEEAVKNAQAIGAQFQETITNSLKQGQPNFDSFQAVGAKLQETLNNSLKQIQPYFQGAQEQFNEAASKLQPELAKVNADLQEQAQANLKTFQTNMAELQSTLTSQPFNPFEIQRIFMSQQLGLVKQFNRQFEGQLEKLYANVNTASAKINPVK